MQDPERGGKLAGLRDRKKALSLKRGERRAAWEDRRETEKSQAIAGLRGWILF